MAPTAKGTPTDTAIVLPGASSAEGITAGQGSTFHAGDVSRGDIFRGDVRRNTVEVFIDAPDGRQAQLHFVPVGRDGVPGAARTLTLRGPAADAGGEFNLTGIRATPDGRRLIVGHFSNGALYTVDPTSGASAAIAGVRVPNIDGIVLDAH